MSVIVNGSTTKDFKVERGLRQDDPLSLFFVMEALTYLTNKTVENGDFKGFRFNEDEEVSLLQFTDDTVIMTRGNSDNLWCMKAIFRDFEMMSSLKVNFLKSKLYGIHVGDWLMEVASNFFACDLHRFPFKFLGVKVGDISRKINMWRDLINQVKNRLELWKGRKLSFAGRVVLINLVFNTIPIYSLSFYKAPCKVLQQIRQIQSNFLWHGKEDKRFIHWVSWSNVCKTRDKGGLGIKDVGAVNLSLFEQVEMACYA
ncbi:uncharacterized protein LOC131657858 [Vicia villosa]|uniref:uncharacterized protein LOC131657858 n=1 Tax=Vicia villosa TaxID=3911 RepID=UPI00273AF295|nr:uncharacterized protein LOC131657858 [Vicia villosa]